MVEVVQNVEAFKLRSPALLTFHKRLAAQPTPQNCLELFFGHFEINFTKREEIERGCKDALVASGNLSAAVYRSRLWH
jgi:hypothetical protein